jgi:hypothetical protein
VFLSLFGFFFGVDLLTDFLFLFLFFFFQPKRSLQTEAAASPEDIFSALKKRKLQKQPEVAPSVPAAGASPEPKEKKTGKLSHLQNLFKSGALTIPKLKTAATVNKENSLNQSSRV